MPGVGEITADSLYEAGYGSAGDILTASVEDLCQIEGIDEEKAQHILEAAQTYLDGLDAEEVEALNAEAAAFKQSRESSDEPETEDEEEDEEEEETEASVEAEAEVESENVEEESTEESTAGEDEEPEEEASDEEPEAAETEEDVQKEDG